MSKGSTSDTSSKTDWQRLERMRDADIDFSDVPEVTAEMFARAVVRRGLMPIKRKEQVTLRVDADVLAWFKAQGRGYQTRINDLLRAFVEAHHEKR